MLVSKLLVFNGLDLVSIVVLLLLIKLCGIARTFDSFLSFFPCLLDFKQHVSDLGVHSFCFRPHCGFSGLWLHGFNFLSGHQFYLYILQRRVIFRFNRLIVSIVKELLQFCTCLFYWTLIFKVISSFLFDSLQVKTSMAAITATASRWCLTIIHHKKIWSSLFLRAWGTFAFILFAERCH